MSEPMVRIVNDIDLSADSSKKEPDEGTDEFLHEADLTDAPRWMLVDLIKEYRAYRNSQTRLVKELKADNEYWRRLYMESRNKQPL